jgi:hypothetical protein
MGLRITMGLLNRAANDVHIDVVTMIVDKHVIPEKDDCWSCYQPKLYYLITAGFIEMFHYKIVDRRIITGQMLNVLFGFFTLLFFWKYLKNTTLGDNSRLIIFAFFALNPGLAAINVQFTNDSLAIFCGVAAVYFADKFFRTQQRRDFIWLVIYVIACSLTKGSGLVLFAVLFLFFVTRIIAQRSKEMRMKLVKYGLIYTISFLAIVPFAGGYYHNYKKYGSATLSTWDKDRPPLFFERTPVFRPGVLDMFHAWFTFRYLDMIEQPYVTNGPRPYPMHRTSLWSQLYGRTMFLHYDQWPHPWQSLEPFIINIGRLLIILGIIPLLIFLRGMAHNLKKMFIGMRKGFRTYLESSPDLLHLAIAAALFASSILYTYNYRDFSSMKSIYIFPGLISFIKLFADGYRGFSDRKIRAVINFTLLVICLLFITDFGYLIYQHLQYPWHW